MGAGAFPETIGTETVLAPHEEDLAFEPFVLGESDVKTGVEDRVSQLGVELDNRDGGLDIPVDRLFLFLKADECAELVETKTGR